MRNFTIISDPPSLLLWLLLYPFFWLYDKLRWRFFPPPPMKLYAIMIDGIDRQNEYMQIMKAKGYHFQKLEASTP